MRLALQAPMVNSNSSHNKRLLFAIAPWLALGGFLGASACSSDSDPAPPYGTGGSGASGGSYSSGGTHFGSGGFDSGGEGGLGGEGGMGGDSATSSGL